MAQTYDNTNSGALFKNDKKETPKHPDYRGKINVEGTEYWLSAWVKDGKNGKYMSLSVTPKDDAKPRAAPPRGGGKHFDDMADDIPFVTCALEQDVTFRRLRWPLE